MKARATNLLLYPNFDTRVTLACVSDITNETLVSGNRFPKYIHKETKKTKRNTNKSKTATPCVKIRVQLNESKSNLLLYPNFDTRVTLACVSDTTNETLISGNKFPKYMNKETKKAKRTRASSICCTLFPRSRSNTRGNKGRVSASRHVRGRRGTFVTYHLQEDGYPYPMITDISPNEPPGFNLSPQARSEPPGFNLSPQAQSKPPGFNLSPQAQSKPPGFNLSTQTQSKPPGFNLSPQEASIGAARLQTELPGSI
jgi:hypothetical protein